MPLKIWRENIYYASAGFYDGVEGIATYHKKWDEEYDDLVDFKGKRAKIYVGSGFYKSFSLKNRYISAEKIVFFAKGDKNEIEKLLEQAVTEGMITCPECDNNIEPDAERCYCGWVNPLREYGYI